MRKNFKTPDQIAPEQMRCFRCGMHFDLSAPLRKRHETSRCPVPLCARNFWHCGRMVEGKRVIITGIDPKKDEDLAEIFLDT